MGMYVGLKSIIRYARGQCYWALRPKMIAFFPTVSVETFMPLFLRMSTVVRNITKKKKGRLIEQFFFIVTDTLSLGDRTIDNMDRHAGQNRPRNQLLADPSGLKPKVEPMFDYSQNTNVTALIGKTAYLTCRVRNLGDKTVRPFATFIIFDSDLYC